jgi:hypothetical protein
MNNQNPEKPTFIYKNVMEFLVDEEITEQINTGKTTINFGYYVNLVQVATYALNRLPPLYASSIEGLARQERRGKQELKPKIEQAVSLAFGMIERDPHRKSTPIQSYGENQFSEDKTYKNVMEFFVNQEISHQICYRKTPINLNNDINLVEVATYALNRLRPLYASSKDGIEKQKRKAKKELKRKIEQAVSLGFAAVERDPIRKSTPIQTEEEEKFQETKESIQELENTVSQQELSWIVSFMESFLDRVNQKQVSEEEVVKLYYLLYYYWQDSYD